MAHVTIPQALQYVADHPVPSSDAPIEMPAWELIARALYDIAQHPNPAVRGSMAQATRAQKMLLDRLVGTRRPGSNPAARKNKDIEFVDLTVGVLTV